MALQSRRSASATVVHSTETGDWVFAYGAGFPDNPPKPPNGSVFWRTDFAAWYTWEQATETWVAIGGVAAPPGAGVVPLGGIIMWSGTIATIPSDWALCDGTLNAPGPDLRDKFVVGARQDDAGSAKTNIEGSLKITGGVSGHSHSGHADLSHAGAAVGDHTGLTHGLTIANHPDLTHVAIGDHISRTLTIPDHASRADLSFPSHTHASAANASFPAQTIASGVDISVPTGSIASHAIGSVPSQTMAIASTAGVSSFASGTNRSGLVSRVATTVTYTSIANASGPTRSIAAATASRPTLPVASHANVSVPSASGASGANISAPALSHGTLSLAAYTHDQVGTHKGTDYGVHTFTAPAAHGVAGTLTHSFTESDDHTLSAHDTVLSLPNYYALAFIQRMA